MVRQYTMYCSGIEGRCAEKSTGKIGWQRMVAAAFGSLAQYVQGKRGFPLKTLKINISRKP